MHVLVDCQDTSNHFYHNFDKMILCAYTQVLWTKQACDTPSLECHTICFVDVLMCMFECCVCE